MAWLAVAKKAGALQYANWPKRLRPSPLTQRPWRRLCRSWRRVSLSPLKPNQRPTEKGGRQAPAGSGPYLAAYGFHDVLLSVLAGSGHRVGETRRPLPRQ